MQRDDEREGRDRKKRMKAEIVVMFMDRIEPPVHDYRKHVMFWTV